MIDYDDLTTWDLILFIIVTPFLMVAIGFLSLKDKLMDRIRK